jgi:hypothetical protein
MPPTPNGKSMAEYLHELEARNAELQKQVEELTAERDGYLHMVHSWAKAQITPELLKQWMTDEQVEGSLVDFINEVKCR